MTGEDLARMKPKLVAIFVVGLLSLSVVATAVAAIGQAVSEEPGASSIALSSYSNEIGDTKGDNRLVSSFKLVCPFH